MGHCLADLCEPKVQHHLTVRRTKRRIKLLKTKTRCSEQGATDSPLFWGQRSAVEGIGCRGISPLSRRKFVRLVQRELGMERREDSRAYLPEALCANSLAGRGDLRRWRPGRSAILRRAQCWGSCRPTARSGEAIAATTGSRTLCCFAHAAAWPSRRSFSISSRSPAFAARATLVGSENRVGSDSQSCQ